MPRHDDILYICGSGYYHGVMQAVVAEIGADQILEEADTLCSDLRERQEHSLYHRDCAHGLGHGFMGVLENELFDSLEACDALADGWEREHCYTGVFRVNVQAKDDPAHKYLKADRPLYPCTAVEARYKDACYRRQPMYALLTLDYDFAKVFDLCEEIEDESRPNCYHGLGRSVFFQSIEQHVTDVAQAGSTRILCGLGEDPESRSNCVIGRSKPSFTTTAATRGSKRFAAPSTRTCAPYASRKPKGTTKKRFSLIRAMKNVVIATLISAILGLAMIGGALYWRLGQSNGGGDDSSGITAHRSYTVEELARYDGEDGNECLVAVHGKVYQIEGFALWKGGEHIPSRGRARCGLDLTKVIDDSPHGRSKLRLLQEVGTLERDSLR